MYVRSVGDSAKAAAEPRVEVPGPALNNTPEIKVQELDPRDLWEDVEQHGEPTFRELLRRVLANHRVFREARRLHRLGFIQALPGRDPEAHGTGPRGLHQYPYWDSAGDCQESVN